MKKETNIEWTCWTNNPWIGCTSVHAGCDNCYAETYGNRYGVAWGNDAERRQVKSSAGNFLGMQAEAAMYPNERNTVFVGSLMDIFEKPMRLVDHLGNELNYLTAYLRDRIFNEVVPACPNLMFLFLTKRPSNINKMIPNEWRHRQPDNVMYGASIVNPETAIDVRRSFDKVIGKKFYSVEPQISFIEFGKGCSFLDGIDWVIQGGESGPKRRPFNTDWARNCRDACATRDIPYFFKQVDKVQPIPADLEVRQFPAWF